MELNKMLNYINDNSGLFLSFLTLAAVTVAIWQLRKNTITSTFDFLTRYEEGFFENKIVCKLINALICGVPVKLEKDICMFKIRNDAKEERISFTEIDNVLGYFETLGYLLKRNVIDLKSIHALFGYYCKMLWDEILEKDKCAYLELCRVDDKFAYIYYQYLYKQLMVYSPRSLKCLYKKLNVNL